VKVKASDKSYEQISERIKRMFPRYKEGGSRLYIDEENNTSYEVKGESTGMVLERGNYDWTPEELAVARSMGIVINE